MEILNLKELVEQNAKKFRDSVAYQMKRDGKYQTFTYHDVFLKVCALQKKLRMMGVGVRDRVALLSESRPEWSVSYLAIGSMGAVVVPLDAMLKKEDIHPLIADSEPKAFILSDKFLEFSKGTMLEGKEIRMDDFDKLPSSAGMAEETVSLDSLLAIVYTSGTTGSPKGVMLTHRNVISDATAGASCFELSPKDNFLSVLPMHHMFETTGGIIAPFLCGCRVTYIESLKSYNLIAAMQETGVTLMLGVPLLYQLLFDGIMREVEEKGKQKLFGLLFSISRFCRDIIGINVGRKLFSVIHKKFGGKIRFFVSGGAAIAPDLVHGFDLMGFPIIQGYGLTESSPVLTITTLRDNVIGSVGRAVPGVEVMIAGDDPVGEILGRGPNIMKGYYKRKDLTDKVLINGWLWTGDIGYLDDTGHLFITGRSKDVIVTGSGVNVYPEEIEITLKKVAAFKEVCILGEKMKEGARRGMEVVIAIIHPNYEYFEKQGKNDDEAFVKQVIDAEVQKYNQGTAEFKRIARFIIRKEEFPKTRLLKIKRFELRKELGI
ncbi:MAG: AMP-binding protein [Candidatus Margulisbacteria bacterium]|nr:AMP-binding protein [Candidatus Margulisiibacteriota bacterium]